MLSVGIVQSLGDACRGDLGLAVWLGTTREICSLAVYLPRGISVSTQPTRSRGSFDFHYNEPSTLRPDQKVYFPRPLTSAEQI
jgi:hypothetical protein